jgi:phosphate:Na+ symporter
MQDILFPVIGGLGLFLYGMGMMSDGLKGVAGQKLKDMLDVITKNRIIAILVGTFITGIIQSSSAMTVMTVGFVNAGLLSLKQALGVILGANIGTTMTAWLVSLLGSGLNITTYALPAIGVGFLIEVLSKTQKWKSIAMIILGFGLLFIGIGFMEEAFKPMQNSGAVVSFITNIANMPMMPLIAVLAGTAITCLIQSSSASIAIIQLMAFSGVFGTDWPMVLMITIPFVLGDNIGTTITAQLAALRTNRNGKRVAWAHSLFNIFGVCWILPLAWLGYYSQAIIWAMDHLGNQVLNIVSMFSGKEFAANATVLSKVTIMFYIAIAHSMFNILNVIVFTPILSLLEKAVYLILPIKEDEIAEKPVVLEEHLLNTPEIALDQAKRAIGDMAKRCKKTLKQSMDGFFNNDSKSLDKALKNEDRIDEYQEHITTYLVKLSQRQLSDIVSSELPVLLHTVNDLERVGDHAKNIVELALRKIENKMQFGESAIADIEQMLVQTESMFGHLIKGLGEEDIEKAKIDVKPALENEANLNRMQLEFRRNHVDRMGAGACTAQAGILFIDVIDNIEKIGDHLTNITQSVIGGMYWDGIEPAKALKESAKQSRK